jgi:hypothetical protein
MPYGMLARELGLRIGELTARLEALMEVDAARGEPFRAALLCQRLSPERLPAPGFFEKLQALGYAIEDPAGFVADQRRRLRAV